MTRVVPSQKFNICVCLVVDKEYGHGECNLCTIVDREELFLFNSDPMSHWVIVAISVFIFLSLSFH